MEQGEIPTTYEVWPGEEYWLSKKRIFLSRNRNSCAAEGFHRDTTLEDVDQRVLNNSKNRQWTTVGDVSARRWTPASHNSEWPYCFLQTVDSTLVYCYRCINVGFFSSSTSAAPWTACKGAFMQSPPHGKPLTTASAMGSWSQSLVSWLAPSCLFRWITFRFVGLR